MSFVQNSLATILAEGARTRSSWMTGWLTGSDLQAIAKKFKFSARPAWLVLLWRETSGYGAKG